MMINKMNDRETERERDIQDAIKYVVSLERDFDNDIEEFKATWETIDPNQTLEELQSSAIFKLLAEYPSLTEGEINNLSFGAIMEYRASKK